MTTYQALPTVTIRSMLDDANLLSDLITPVANDEIKALLADLSGSLASALTFSPVVETVS